MKNKENAKQFEFAHFLDDLLLFDFVPI